MNIVQLKKLSYDEVAKCNRCGFCLPSCPTYLVKKTEAYSARGRNAITRFAIENKLELNADTERAIFTCLGCGACNAVCLSSVQTKDLIFQNRECQVDVGFYPKVAKRLVKILEDSHNISDEDQEDRTEWQELIKELPEELEEAARIDGCSNFGVLTRIVMPLLIPGLVSAGTLVFIFSWNDFIYPLFLSSIKAKTLAVVMPGFITDKGLLWGPMTSLGTLMIVPVVIVALSFQRYLVRGLTLGAIK